MVEREVYYDDPPLTKNQLSVFLAGPSSHAKWRGDAVKMLREGGFKGTIVIPEFRSGVFDKSRFDDCKPSTIPGMSRSSELIMEWETQGIDNSTVLMVWMPYTGFDDPRQWTGLSTRGESARAIICNRSGLVLGMPSDAFRSGQDRFHAYKKGIPIHTTLESSVNAALEMLWRMK